jgi:predicted amidophosphoribosyltransferase
VKKEVYEFKFENGKQARARIVRDIADAVTEIAAELSEWVGTRTILIQKIPSSPLRWIRHGYDHMLLLRWKLHTAFKRLDSLGSIRCIAALKRRWKILDKQSHLSRDERIGATRDLFYMRPGSLRKLRARNDVAVIVIDDVLTTGATMDAAISVFIEASIPCIGLAYCYQPAPAAATKAF